MEADDKKQEELAEFEVSSSFFGCNLGCVGVRVWRHAQAEDLVGSSS
jgi:hypothetical protein